MSRKSFFTRDREHVLFESRNIRKIRTGNGYFAPEAPEYRRQTEEESYKEHFIEKLEAVTSSSHPPLWDKLLTVLEKSNSS